MVKEKPRTPLTETESVLSCVSESRPAFGKSCPVDLFIGPSKYLFHHQRIKAIGDFLNSSSFNSMKPIFPSATCYAKTVVEIKSFRRKETAFEQEWTGLFSTFYILFPFPANDYFTLTE